MSRTGGVLFLCKSIGYLEIIVNIETFYILLFNNCQMKFNIYYNLNTLLNVLKIGY